MSTTDERYPPFHIGSTPAGSKIFAERDRRPRPIRVVESALKVNGPCVWVFCDSAEGVVHDGIQLNIEDAHLVVDGLQRFIAQAEEDSRRRFAAEERD